MTGRGGKKVCLPEDYHCVFACHLGPVESGSNLVVAWRTCKLRPTLEWKPSPSIPVL